MKNIITAFSPILCLLFAVSCQGDANDTYTFPKTATTDFDDIWTLEKVGTKTFELDSTMGIQSQSIQYYKENNTEKVSILNPLDRSLHIYDYQTGQLTNKIKFELEGEHGIGSPSNMGHYMDRSDSIFLFNHWENRVYLLNENAKVLNRYNLGDTTLTYESFLMINSSSPAFKKGSTLYITAQNSGINNAESELLIALELKTSKIRRYVKGSDFMQKAFWGPFTTYTLSTSFDTKRERIITSVGKDPEVRRFTIQELSTASDEVVLGSKYVPAFQAFPKKDDKPTLFGYSYREISSETNKKALYMSIIYNENKDLYYRMLLLPRTDEEYKLGLDGMTRTVIISDGELKKVGEFKLPTGEHKIDYHFMNDQGLHLVNLKEFEKDEDKLVFDIYQAVKR